MIVYRQAVRAILITPDREILLMRIRPPEGGRSFWITPGGGLEAGEPAEVALRRELREELGLDLAAAGPVVWLRRHTFDWGGTRYCQTEEYWALRVARFEPIMSDAVEAKVLQEFRWWPLAEIAASAETFAPASLAAIAERYLGEGAPAKVPPMEVLVD